MDDPAARLSPLLDWIDQLPGMDAGLARRARGRPAILADRPRVRFA
jgi:hypothetical protein